MSAAIQSPISNQIPISAPEETSALTEIQQNLSDSRAASRVYISNLNFSTTEEELEDFFQSYSIVNVLIPSHTVRGFRTPKHRPLGIAYAEFGTAEQAQKACQDLNGSLFKNRKLVIKAYIPYSPKSSKLKGRRSLHKQSSSPKAEVSQSTESNENDIENEVSNENEVPAEENIESGVSKVNTVRSEPTKLTTTENVVKAEEAVSKDTIFIGKLTNKVTHDDLREFFSGYNTGEIYLFKGKSAYHKHRSSLKFRQRYVSALVTIESQDSLENVISEHANKRIQGKQVVLRPAILSKVEEVKKASKLLEEQENVKAEKESKVVPEEAVEEEEEEEEEAVPVVEDIPEKSVSNLNSDENLQNNGENEEQVIYDDHEQESNEQL